MEELETTESTAINPKNPFENETEFEDYNSDYGEIVPQIRLEGCKLPLFPNSREKSRIRRYFNIVGGFMLGHFALVQVLFLILEESFLFFIALVDGAETTLPDNYRSLAWEYFQNSSSNTALTMLCIAGCNILIAWLGCSATKIPISTLFQTKKFNILTAFNYILITMFLHSLTVYMSYGVEKLFEGINITITSSGDTNYHNMKILLLDFIYGVIVAPITEELLVRGFVLKNLSRVSQRFGIIASAFFFGVWHGNIPQFILAFTVGCFWGYIAVKHNSLIPSMLAHMFMNCYVTLLQICNAYNWEIALTILNIFYMILALVGMVLLIRMVITERLPYSTPEQSERGTRLALTSPLLVGVFLCYIFMIAHQIVNNNA